jgi:hypothetical protein
MPPPSQLECWHTAREQVVGHIEQAQARHASYSKPRRGQRAEQRIVVQAPACVLPNSWPCYNLLGNCLTSYRRLARIPVQVTSSARQALLQQAVINCSKLSRTSNPHQHKGSRTK